MANKTGTNGPNTLEGTSLKDFLSGLGGNDRLIGKASDDILDGGTGKDSLEGGLGDDTMHGGDDDDNLLGGTGDDNMFGDAGNDTLNGELGRDIIDGGAGDDIIKGEKLDDILHGGSGNDLLTGLLNNDTLFGDAGDDKLIGGVNDDILHGGTGNDFLIGARGTKEGVEDFTGDDDLFGEEGDDILAGGNAEDLLDGGDGFDIASYDPDDEISGPDNFAVTVDLVAGTATRGLTEHDTLISIEGVRGTPVGDTMDGDSNRNLFDGRGGNDDLSGAGGNDTLKGGGGQDVLDGGTGSDTATYAGSGTAVTVNLLNNTATGGVAQGDTLESIENLIGTSGNDTLTGSNAANILEGGDGGDTINGRGGSDTASYLGSAKTGVVVNLLTGAASGGHAAGDTLLDIENLTGSGLDDTLTGDTGANVLSGNAGRDILTGGDGGDTIDGGADVDKADYAGSLAGVTVNLSLAPGAAQTSAGAASGDKLFNIEDVSGSSFGDLLTGSADANRLSGRGGDDRMEGGGNSDNYIAGAGLGADRIFDSAGVADVLTISSFAQIVSSTRVGDDLRIVYSDGGSVVIEKHFIGANTIETALDATTNTSVVLASGTIGGSAGGILSGTDGDDVLAGRGGNDRLFGNEGVDVLIGGRGKDTLIGGGGADGFLFGPLEERKFDRITDFEADLDEIRLDRGVFTKLKLGDLKEKAFFAGKGADAAQDRTDRIVYDTKSGELRYDEDGKGGKEAVLFAILNDSPNSVTNQDFVVVA